MSVLCIIFYHITYIDLNPIVDINFNYVMVKIQCENLNLFVVFIIYFSDLARLPIKINFIKYDVKFDINQNIRF
jgi:hypothetical protein